jgi:MFS family permease
MTEWKRGWPIVLGAGLGGGTGAALLFYTFSLFIIPMTTEFGASRGDMANVQALVGIGALGAPVIGLATDQFGFRRVFTICMCVVAACHFAIAGLVTGLQSFALCTAVLGAFAMGTSALTITRPVNAWFDQWRGLALATASMGISLTTLIVPPILNLIIQSYGWRSGYVALGIIAIGIGLPSVLLLVKNEPGTGRVADPVTEAEALTLGSSVYRSRHFWLLSISLLLIGIPGAGFLSQMSPMIQEEGATAGLAALAVSAYAGGQLIGRLISGFLLDRIDPRIVAFAFTFLPATGFFMLVWLDHAPAFALVAAAFVGIQQGAEIDIFAYFVARSFGMEKYGRAYGGIIGVGWIGNAIGVLGFGRLHDVTGSYTLAQAISGISLILASILITSVRLTGNATSRISVP